MSGAFLLFLSGVKRYLSRWETREGLFIQRTLTKGRSTFPLAGRIGPGGDGGCVERSGGTFTGENLRGRDGFVIRRWKGAVAVSAVGGGRWFAG